MSAATVDLPTGSREVQKLVTAHEVLEGAGVRVHRPFPTARLPLLDPFLLLDHLGPMTWAPGEAIGFPDHPHRGFETVTYVLAGQHQHRDSAGNSGVLGPGDVQWMTAGSGVVHSEMPGPEMQIHGGPSHGFQIWVNLPADQKMMTPRYQEVPRDQIPVGKSDDGLVTARVIAGQSLGAEAVIDTVTPITLLHLTLRPGGRIRQAIPGDHDAGAYVFEGEVEIGAQAQRAGRDQLALLGAGDAVDIENVADAPADVLVLSGVPLNEPVARYGPFVMNSEAQIRQAIRDYQSGRMGQITV